MTIATNYSFARGDDVTLQVSMVPPTSIAGWSIQFLVQKHFGGLSGLITKTGASGYGGGQSGVTVTNSGQGVFNIAIAAQNTSGFEFSPLSYAITRLDSGSTNVLTEGFVNILPSMRQ